MTKKIYIINRNMFAIFFLAMILFQCKSRKESKNISFLSIENYFVTKGWDFPIYINDTTLAVKYYHDKNGIVNVPQNLAEDIKEIKNIYKDKSNGKNLLMSTLINSEKKTIFGYVISLPTIFIDTSDYGSKFHPKLFLGFLVSKYKINNDSLSLGLPCENCISEEKNKILRYPGGIFFELNEAKDSLLFSRWD